MANPRAEATYARAMAAFQEGSFDVARRLIGDILVDDPGHAGARALRTRLEARMSSAASARSGHTPTPGSFRSTQGGRGNVPEATSVDPTVLIDRASSAFQPPEYIEPTVVVQREEVERYRDAARGVTPPVPPPPSQYGRSSRSEPAPEPTIMVPPKRAAAAAPAVPRRSGGLLDRVKDLAGASPSPKSSPSRKSSRSGRQPGGFWTPTTRGAAMAVGGIVVAALLIVGVVALVRWLWPGGYVLTIARPVGGTVVGSGFQCGTRGSDCALTKAADDTVELKPVPDSGYVFSGFTDDCAPSGRVLMTRDKSCGATFGAVTPSAGAGEPGGPRTWPLTIEKPTGGTIVGDGGISCGTLGTTCTASIQDGAPVVLNFQSDKDYQFLQFTGDCGPEGKFTMTGARTCGASFAPTPTPMAVARPRSPSPPPSGGGSKPATAPVGGQPVPAPPVQTPAPPPSVPTPAPAGSAQSNTPGTPSGSGQPPPVSGGTGLVPQGGGPGEKLPEVTITPEAHARKEIAQLVKDYCAALDTLQPDRLKKLYPQVDMAFHREAFRQYKSLKCSLVGDPEFERLDAGPAGGAQVKIGMKQQIEMKTGGAPKALETIATFVVSRMSNQSPWLIDRLKVEQKPK